MKDFIETSMETSNAVVNFGRAATFEINEANVENVTVLDVMNATSSNDAVAKLVKIWENKNAQRAVRGAGLATMALSLAACGSDSADEPAAPTTPVQPTDLTVSPETVSFSGTLNAGRAYTPGGNDLVNTLQTDDSITGTGSADVINVTFGNNNDAGAATIAPTMSGVETINFANVSSNGAVDTLDMSNVTGTTAVNVSSLSDDTIIRGIDSTSIALKAFNVSDEAADVAFEFDDTAVAGTADAISLTVDNFNGNEINFGSAATETADGAGIETLNLVASGSASTVANLGSTAVTTINVDADAALTVSAIAATGVTALNLTGSTATTSINAGANVGANEFTYTGGSGNDTLIVSTGFAGTDTLAAGDGSDTLSIRATADVAAVGALSALSAAVATGWETLDLRAASIAGAGAVDFTVDMDHLPGVTAISMRVADDDTKSVFTLNDLTQTQAENLSVLHTGTDADTDSEIIVDMKTNGTDTVKLSATVTTDSQVVELNDANDNIENAEITLAGAATTNLDVDVSSFLTSLTVSGGVAGESLVITNAHTSATVNMASVASDVTMTLGAGTQTATFGSGDDAITMASGVKTVNTGAGDDTVSTTVALLGTAASSWDSINAGDGTDTLALTSIAAVTAEAGQNLTGFERLSMTDAAAAATTMNLAAFGSTFSRITVGDTNDALVTITNAAAAFSDLRFSADAENDTEVALERTIDAAANALTVTIARGETIKTLTIDDEESVTFNQSGSAGNIAITDLNAGDMTSMVITGAGGFTASDVSSTALATVDASAATGAVTVSAANSVVAVTATGNSTAGGVFTFTGGSGADNITGGLAADVLTGGLGNDTISGGAGADTIDGDGGTNTLTGGSGADIFIIGEGTNTITDFVVGAANDDIHLDLSGLEALSGSDLVMLDDFASVADSDTVAYTTITGATDLSTATANSMILVLNGASIDSLGALETALETGGTYALTINGTVAAGDGFLALYDNGTTSYLAYVESGAIADNALAGSGTLTATLVATFEGIADCTTILAANFADIIA